MQFENGLQICWYQSAAATPTNTQTVAPWWDTAIATFVYPHFFIAPPTVIPSSHSSSSGLGITVTGIGGASCSFRGYGVNSGQYVRFGYVAVGR